MAVFGDTAEARQTFIMCYRLVWATEMLLAATGLVFPALVLGYKLFNYSRYQVPVPTLIG